jgi:nucleoid DNA-binding protein
VIKDDLAKSLAADFDLSLNLAGRIVQTILDNLITGLVTDGHIELRRFGVFTIKHQAPRWITLPSGKKIAVPAQRVATFAASPTEKKKLNPPPPPKPRTLATRKRRS